MFIRVLLTALVLAIMALAALVIDCTARLLEFLDGDPIGVCAALDPLTDDLRLWVGIGLLILGVLVLVVVWARPGTRRSPDVEETLVQNLSRLPELTHGSVEVGATSREHVDSLTLRLEAVMAALENDGDGSRDATRQWIGLLREANELHNLDELTTEDFKTINTRLLGLFSSSGQQDPAAAESGLSPQAR
jgi:hypothetical protein